MILAGDIGGTNARLAFFESHNESLHQVSEQIFPSREFAEFGDVVGKFLGKSKAIPEVACFGIAGPVRDGRVETSNLPWKIDRLQLAEQIRVPLTLLINDLEATAWSIAALGADDLATLHSVDHAAGNQAVIAAGTGLGEAGLFWDGSDHLVFACEGGHTDFAAQGPLQAELLRYLAGRFGHVSYERILSGPGLVNVYEFLREKKPGGNGSTGLTLGGDAAAAISRMALQGSDELAVQALDLWIFGVRSRSRQPGLENDVDRGDFFGGWNFPQDSAEADGARFSRRLLR